MSLDEYLIKNKEATYIITVKGESMKDAIDRIEKDAIELRINQAVIKTKLEAD
jgi:SOS-response transcriptional repressor LexA